MKTKIKSYGDKVTDLQKFLGWILIICLAVTTLISALKKDKNYYPQVFLKEYKYIKEKFIRDIIQDIGKFSCDSDEDFFFFCNPIQDGRGKKAPSTNFCPVTSTNVVISPQNFLTSNFHPFSQLMKNI